MSQEQLFSVLDEVDSTNNYAMGMCRTGQAKHGSCWFAHHQYMGKGTRGKTWKSEAGSNIAMSLTIAPKPVFIRNPFLVSALVAVTCRDFIKQLCVESTCLIKWPNDIYINDKKAAGILLETIFTGSTWAWCIIGVGINVNQKLFDEDLTKVTSLYSESNEKFEPEHLSRKLYKDLLQNINDFKEKDMPALIETYNHFLYKRGKLVSLKKDSATFKTRIESVDDFGSLVTWDTMEKKFSFGDVEWVL